MEGPKKCGYLFTENTINVQQCFAEKGLNVKISARVQIPAQLLAVTKTMQSIKQHTLSQNNDYQYV